MSKFMTWLGSFLKEHWILVTGLLVAIVLIWFGQEAIAAVLAMLGLGGDKFNPNKKPKNRKVAIGEEDEKGIKQKAVEVVDDDIELAKEDTPDGVDEDDVEVVIKSDAKVEVSENKADLDDRVEKVKKARKKAKKSRAKLNKLLGEDK